MRELPFGYLGKQLNRNKIRHCERLVDRQTFFFFSFSLFLDVCNNWISTEQLLYHEDGLKSCCLKNTAGLSLLHWWVPPSPGKPEISPVKCCFYTQYCWILSIAFGLLFDLLLFFFFFVFLCRLHDRWHHIVSKTQMSHAFYANRCLKIVFFCFFCNFCTVDNKIISPDVWIYYMTTFASIDLIITSK